MTQTKEQVEKLVASLADKTLSFGCWYYSTIMDRGGNPILTQFTDFDCEADYVDEILGHRIDFTRVLWKIAQKHKKPVRGKIFLELWDLWERCGFPKSVQQIIEESMWETVECATPSSCPPPTRQNCQGHEQLADPRARALLAFMGEIFNPNSKDE